MEKARVFNIERFATEDGEGIRTVVFFKGCGLRCRWCANPESQLFKTEVLVKDTACIRCGKCEKFCPHGAIKQQEPYGYITDSSLCEACGTCIDNCFVDARQIMGREYTIEELIKEVLKDEQYFVMSGGGVTFSGGEPLFYSGFIKKAAIKLAERGISTLVETSGFVPLKNIKEVAPCVQHVFYDLKHMLPEKHRELTGQDNKLIIENLKWLNDNFFGKISVRYPYIPGCNSDKDALQTFFEFVKTLKNLYQVVVLPYHRLGMMKYTGLGRSYPMGDMVSLKKNQLNCVVELGRKYGIDVKIG